IVTALVAGAVAGLNSTSGQAIKDAYAGVKGLIQRKYERVGLALLEEEPASKARQAVVHEDLEHVGAGQDQELLGQAKVLLDAIEANAPEVPQTVGLELADITGASLTAERILAEGGQATGIRVRGATITGDIAFRDVTARSAEDTPPKKA